MISTVEEFRRAFRDSEGTGRLGPRWDDLLAALEEMESRVQHLWEIHEAPSTFRTHGLTREERDEG